MKINWRVRFRNKPFLVSLFSLVLLVVQQVASLFGFDTTLYNEQATGIFQTLLFVLTFVGVVIDPTTDSVSDSEQALGYTDPKKDEEQ